MQQQWNLWYLSLCRFQIAGGARLQSRDICRLSICRFAFRSICPLTRQTSAFTSRRLVISTLWDDKSRRNNRSTNNEPTDKLLIIIKGRPWRQWRVCRNLKMRERAKLQRIQIWNIHQSYCDEIVLLRTIMMMVVMMITIMVMMTSNTKQLQVFGEFERHHLNWKPFQVESIFDASSRRGLKVCSATFGIFWYWSFFHDDHDDDGDGHDGPDKDDRGKIMLGTMHNISIMVTCGWCYSIEKILMPAFLHFCNKNLSIAVMKSTSGTNTKCNSSVFF